MITARQARVQIAFDGIDVSKNISDDLISLRYTDSEDDEADDLQLTLQDRDAKWLTTWLDDALIAQLNTEVRAGKSKGLSITGSILCDNWTKPGEVLRLDCGKFALDDNGASGPPSQITLKSASLPDYKGYHREKPELGKRPAVRRWERDCRPLRPGLHL